MIEWFDNGGYILTSGTTGTAKKIYQSPEKIRASCKVAVEQQKISVNSRILTVCKMDHAGGLLAQTLPGLSVGADVDILDFKVNNFINKLGHYTHTHLTPRQARIVCKHKDFNTMDLSKLWITCGSDPVDYDIIESFVRQNATFMANWGMTEVGPIAINTVFKSLEQVYYYKSITPVGCTILGDNFALDTKVQEQELYVKGDISVYEDFFNTGDKVEVVGNIMFYRGRV